MNGERLIKVSPEFAVVVPEPLVVAKHRLGRFLGSGGWGSVYEGEHIHMRERRALKICHHADGRNVADSGNYYAQRAINEAKIGALLRHPAICVVHDLDWMPNGAAVIVMDLLTGHTLADEWEAAGCRLPWRSVFLTLSRVCDALAFAHARGVVHRDIKMQNIFLTPTGPKVMDFGIAMLAAERITRTGTHVGSPYYMAPEQIKDPRKVDGRADVYSCGAIFYHALTGKPLFDGQPQDVVRAALNDERPPILPLLPSLPPRVAAVIERCVARDPWQRYQSAGELKAALDHCLLDGFQAGADDITARPPEYHYSPMTPEPSFWGDGGVPRVRMSTDGARVGMLLLSDTERPTPRAIPLKGANLVPLAPAATEAAAPKRAGWRRILSKIFAPLKSATTAREPLAARRA